MAMKLEFNRIKNQSIFQPEFQNFDENGYNIIEFKKQPQATGGIAVVYAPNGTGKSSLTAVLENNDETNEELSFEAVFNDNQIITSEIGAFHIIGDQISRNVIKGETSDYLIGREIRREYYLKKEIANEFKTAFNELNLDYKNNYKITKVTDYFLTILQQKNFAAYNFIRNIVKKQSKGKEIDKEQFIAYVRDVQNRPRLADVEENKKQFIIKNATIIEQFMQIDLEQIVTNENVQEIEKNDDAINILEKYKHLHNCIVCDNDQIDGDLLLQRKTERQKQIYAGLDEKTKSILNNIAMNPKLLGDDPFEIKKNVLNFISLGNYEPVCLIKEDIISYLNQIVDEMVNKLFERFSRTNMYSLWDEYSRILETQPTLDNEELLYIEKIISENIGRDIRITRDDENDHNFKLMLGD